MQLFIQSKGQFCSLKEKPFQLEKQIQNIFEANLEAITGLLIVKSEFIIKAQRFDTIAFDKESKAFVIIEYKRERNFSVIDQGISYLNLMLDNKAEFIVEFNESQQQNLKRTDIDWSQSKVIFIAPSFSDFQRQASNFKDLPIELWEIKQYENDIILINPIKKSKAAPTIKTIEALPDSGLEKVAKEITVYTEDRHLNGKSEDVIELYESFKRSILQLSDEIEIIPKKWYLAFKTQKNVVDIEIQKSRLKLWINMKKGTLDDPKQITRDVSALGHGGNGDYEIIISNTRDLEYIMSLVKQAI
jgi:predicted transport protein